MKHIFLNLKRFDIPPALGGVNRLASAHNWSQTILTDIQQALKAFEDKGEFVIFFPEAHLLSADAARCEDSPVQLGCQSVYREDTSCGGNFGAFTANRTANSMKALGCSYTIIGHCEERKDKMGILAEAGVTDPAAINRLMNKQILAATSAGLKVLYCIGETAEEQENWQQVLRNQLEIGLCGVDKFDVVIAYEPVWSIGPGKTPADKPYIEKVARFIKDVTENLPVVYGGGLKTDNASMLASISEIDGGLIALTRFQGEIGFYPEEYLQIIQTYFE